MRIIENIFDFGQIVYLKTDSDQKDRIVTAMIVRGDGSCMYELSCGDNSKWHYEFEITIEKNVVISTTN